MVKVYSPHFSSTEYRIKIAEAFRPQEIETLSGIAFCQARQYGKTSLSPPAYVLRKI